MSLLALALLSAGCGQSPAGCNSSNSRESIAVASSLTEWSDTYVRTFGLRHTISLAGSQVLRLQIEHGARPDVFISANRAHADAVAQLPGFGSVELFMCNQMVVAYAKSSFASPPGWVEAITRGERVAIAEATVPAGMYGLDLLERIAARSPQVDVSTVLQRVVSYDFNVRQVLMRLARGEADIGFVYSSDIRHAADVVGEVELPPELSLIAHYYVVHRQTSRATQLADHMKSERSKSMSQALGFISCSETMSAEPRAPQ